MYYFATFEVGTPVKTQSVIIDTGSDTMAFPCESCHGKNCGSHQYPRFSVEHSHSFKYKIRCSNPHYIGGHQVCKFVKSYAEGSSLYGFLGIDLIRFKNAKKVYGSKLKHLNGKLKKDMKMNSEFGCTEKETGLFKTQYADGILGLDDQSEFIRSMEQLNGNGQKVMSFGLCFHEHGGIMSIDLRHKYKPDDKIRMLNKDINEYQKPLIIQYDSSNMYYEIPMYGFALGNDMVKFDQPVSIMIDSGTTFSHFPSVVMHQILHELNKWCKKDSNYCGKIPHANFKEDSCLELRPPDENFKNADELLATFPNFHVYLGNKRSYILRPKNYFYREYLEDPKERKSGLVRLCMAIKGHSDERIILGAFSMVDHYFYFDRKTQTMKIFRENCYLRTKGLVKRERILEATVEDIHFEIGQNQVINNPGKNNKTIVHSNKQNLLSSNKIEITQSHNHTNNLFSSEFYIPETNLMDYISFIACLIFIISSLVIIIIKRVKKNKEKNSEKSSIDTNNRTKNKKSIPLDDDIENEIQN